MITRQQLIKKYIDFFKSKGHKEIPNSSLIPENDPTVLFTTAGMHPLVPFLLGEKHPLGKRLVGMQKCIRTGDIEEVGDEVHHTFFEMLGNWSLGDYWKEDAIKYSIEFLTKELKIPKEKISVTCFKGDKDAPKDTESAEVWKKDGIKKVKFLSKKDNWWGPAGKTGPCGPDTEMFVNNVEIWNDVFMQYHKDANEKYLPAKQKNIDTGMGVERTIAVLNNLKDNYLTECFKPIINKIEELSKKKYTNYKKEMRIIADHIKSAVFIINDGITPSNTEHGYILRRLIRRAIRYGQSLDIRENFTSRLVDSIIEIYSDYPELSKKRNELITELDREENKFRQTLERAINIFERLTKDKKEISCKDSFLLYQSYGFPVEMIEEECKSRKIKFSRKEFENECKIHQELSRTAAEGRFKSGLADNSKATTRLHTASHLLLAAIRKVFNDKDNSIHQKGSNITAERLRFDFNFPRKLTENELKEIEKEVNSNIQKGCPVIRKEMPLEEAKKKGITGVFEHKYGDVVSVYTIGECSKEICTGPHVKNTCELGKFKIIKEESSSSGVRRIKAVVE
ncbi:MAG TPA: alanine--tRNA ligase [Candidatus Pacearchaeota archaeon]|nr:alanine--tRNA ligase [Candidatus Pacearchaeota archaeon]